VNNVIIKVTNHDSIRQEEIAKKVLEYTEIINNDKTYREVVVSNIKFLKYIQSDAVAFLNNFKESSPAIFIKLTSEIDNIIYTSIVKNKKITMELIAEVYFLIKQNTNFSILAELVEVNVLSLHYVLSYIVASTNALFSNKPTIDYAYFKNGEIITVKKKSEEIKISVTFNRSAVDNG